MAAESVGGVRDRIVTLESLQPPMNESLESTSAEPRPELETLQGRLRVERYYQIMERLRQETSNTGSNLMITVPDREASRLQSELARQARDGRALDSGGREVKFGTGVGGGDWFGWMFSLMKHVDREDAHPMVRPTTTKPEPIPDRSTIAIASKKPASQ